MKNKDFLHRIYQIKKQNIMENFIFVIGDQVVGNFETPQIKQMLTVYRKQVDEYALNAVPSKEPKIFKELDFEEVAKLSKS
jgi:hypothetical protein